MIFEVEAGVLETCSLQGGRAWMRAIVFVKYCSRKRIREIVDVGKQVGEQCVLQPRRTIECTYALTYKTRLLCTSTAGEPSVFGARNFVENGRA